MFFPLEVNVDSNSSVTCDSSVRSIHYRNVHQQLGGTIGMCSHSRNNCINTENTLFQVLQFHEVRLLEQLMKIT